MKTKFLLHFNYFKIENFTLIIRVSFKILIIKYSQVFENNQSFTKKSQSHPLPDMREMRAYLKLIWEMGATIIDL